MVGGNGSGSDGDRAASAAATPPRSEAEDEPEHGAGSGDEPPMETPTDPAEIAAAIVKQVEFYFSDANLPTDKHLLKHVKKDPEGYVPIKLIASFKRIRALTPDATVVATALRAAQSLVLDEEGRRVRRATPLAEVDVDAIARRMVVAEHLGGSPTIDSVHALFSKYGTVELVRICSKGQTAKLPPWLAAAVNHLACGDSVFALVEFASEEEATRAVEGTKNPDNWRTSLRVRLLQRGQPGARGLSPQPADGKHARGGRRPSEGGDGHNDHSMWRGGLAGSRARSPFGGDEGGLARRSVDAGGGGGGNARSRRSIDGGGGRARRSMDMAHSPRSSGGGGVSALGQSPPLALAPIRTSVPPGASGSGTGSPTGGNLNSYIGGILAAPTGGGLSRGSSGGGSGSPTRSSGALPASGFGSPLARAASGSPRAPLRVSASGMPMATPTRLSASISAAGAAPAAASPVAGAGPSGSGPAPGVTPAAVAAASAAAMAAISASPRGSSSGGSWTRSAGGGGSGGGVGSPAAATNGAGGPAARSAPVTPQGKMKSAPSFTFDSVPPTGLTLDSPDKPAPWTASHRLRACSTSGGASDGEGHAAPARSPAALGGPAGGVVSDGAADPRERRQSWHAQPLGNSGSDDDGRRLQGAADAVAGMLASARLGASGGGEAAAAASAALAAMLGGGAGAGGSRQPRSGRGSRRTSHAGGGGGGDPHSADEGDREDGGHGGRDRPRRRSSTSGGGNRRQSLDQGGGRAARRSHDGGARSLSPRPAASPHLSGDESHGRGHGHGRSGGGGGGGHGSGGEQGHHPKVKKDYAAWAAATPEFRAKAAAAKAAASAGGAASPQMGSSPAFSPGAAALAAFGAEHSDHSTAGGPRTPRMPDGTRGFTCGRGRPLTPPPPQ